ncbi:MAG: hypothetical protein WAO78_15695 [Roseovarius sp.]
MKIYRFWAVLCATLVPFAAAADSYMSRNTPHFGFVTVEVADDFNVSAVCTVSGGASQERLETVTDFLPGIGSTIMAVLEWASLDKGEVFCGLRHYKGPGPFTVAADTNGFGLNIKAYEGAEQIGSDLSPRFACRPRGLFNVNRYGFYFEDGTGSEIGGKSADYVVACIETTVPSDGSTVSFLVYAGESAPEALKTLAGDGETNVSDQPCADRTF